MLSTTAKEGKQNYGGFAHALKHSPAQFSANIKDNYTTETGIKNVGLHQLSTSDRALYLQKRPSFGGVQSTAILLIYQTLVARSNTDYRCEPTPTTHVNQYRPPMLTKPTTNNRYVKPSRYFEQYCQRVDPQQMCGLSKPANELKPAKSVPKSTPSAREIHIFDPRVAVGTKN